MSEALIDRLVEFAESGNQQKIVLNDQTYQGWVMEISDDAILISTGFSDKAGKDYWIKFTDLNQAELSFWDNKTDQWVAFKI